MLRWSYWHSCVGRELTWLSILALAATKPAQATPSAMVADNVADIMTISLSVGSFSVVNNIRPRVELDPRDLLSVAAPQPSTELQAGFLVRTQDLKSWIGTEAFDLVPR